MDAADLEACWNDWRDLSEEYKILEAVHQQYVKDLDEVCHLQAKCIKEIAHQRYRLGFIKQSMKKMKLKDAEDQEKREDLEKDILRRKAQLYEMEEALPKQNGTYLKIILGNVNVSILNKQEKFKYKDEYEKFKLILSVIGLLLSMLNIVTNYRVMDLIFLFILVWYYCTLTIRESILKVNGSRIKGWWRAHHFLSTVIAGVLLIWPNGPVYYMFRRQFMWFNVYISFVQYLQFNYQRGVLYRLKALGQRHNMDITIEGFHSWMWLGLGFLLPFLYIGYFFEFYNAYALYKLAFLEEATWQVPFLSMMFLVVGFGNTLTTSISIHQKTKDSFKLRYRFTRLDKYFWTHKRRSSIRVSASESKEIEESHKGKENIIIEDKEESRDELDTKMDTTTDVKTVSSVDDNAQGSGNNQEVSNGEDFEHINGANNEDGTAEGKKDK